MIRWCYAFIDRPAAGFEAALAFWPAVTGTALSARRGDRGQFATLLPATGDACVKLQAVGDGGGAHIDLCVDDVPAATRRAVELGAAEVFAEPDLSVMRSPAGQGFCLVDWEGESIHTGPDWTVCVPGEHDFWARLMAPDPDLPVRLHSTDIDRACVGLACDDIDETRHLHESHGATLVAQGPSWIVLRDPAGGVYRLTERPIRE